MSIHAHALFVSSVSTAAPGMCAAAPSGAVSVAETSRWTVIGVVGSSAQVVRSKRTARAVLAVESGVCMPSQQRLRMGEAAVRVTSLLEAAGGSCSRGCTTQDKLHWWGKGLGDDECVALAERLREPGRPRLKNLLLGSNYVGDRCIHALSSAARHGALKSLYALGLSRNRITDVGCEALAGAMRAGQLPQLTDLYISRNLVGNGCAAALASVLRMPLAPPLKRIGLGDGSAGEAGLSSLLAAQHGRTRRPGSGWAGQLRREAPLPRVRTVALLAPPPEQSPALTRPASWAPQHSPCGASPY